MARSSVLKALQPAKMARRAGTSSNSVDDRRARRRRRRIRRRMRRRRNRSVSNSRSN